MAVSTEAEFRERIVSDLKKQLEVDSDKKLRRDVSDRLVDKLKLNYPMSF